MPVSSRLVGFVAGGTSLENPVISGDQLFEVKVEPLKAPPELLFAAPLGDGPSSRSCTTPLGPARTNLVSEEVICQCLGHVFVRFIREPNGRPKGGSVETYFNTHQMAPRRAPGFRKGLHMPRLNRLRSKCLTWRFWTKKCLCVDHLRCPGRPRCLFVFQLWLRESKHPGAAQQGTQLGDKSNRRVLLRSCSSCDWRLEERSHTSRAGRIKCAGFGRPQTGAPAA